jgi:hypothetical protein
MPDLIQSLQDHDLGHLQIIAELWGIELEAPDVRNARSQLAVKILNPPLVDEMLEALPEGTHQALGDLCENRGRMSWPLFTRRYGIIREIGPGRRDRLQPHRAPVSTAERLWYLALIGRAFFDTPNGPEEFVFIPEDLLGYLEQSPALEPSWLNRPGLGRPARAEERAYTILATDWILDDACTLLAALRLEDPLDEYDQEWMMPAQALTDLLRVAGLLDGSGGPNPEATRAFLEAERAVALANLVKVWLVSAEYNELRLMPDLQVEGEWENDTLRARQAVLGFLEDIPTGVWWSLTSFIAAIREAHPDFQRPAGDYDSWYIRSRQTGAYVRGFENWDKVDGALVRYLITGPLHWLGLVDLAAPEEGKSVTGFRYSAWAADLLAGQPPDGLPKETKTVHIRSDGQLGIPKLAPRSARYQIARFCAWEGERGGMYRYRLTPKSLARARQQGLRIGQLLALLSRYAESVPPNIPKALDWWDEKGGAARIQQVAILRVASPELLKTLRLSRAARFLGDPLGPTSIIVKEGAGEKVLAILVEMGYLGEIEE